MGDSFLLLSKVTVKVVVYSALYGSFNKAKFDSAVIAFHIPAAFLNDFK